MELAIRLYKKEQVCQMTGLSLSQLDREIRSGRMTVVRVGKRGVRIPDVEVERYLSVLCRGHLPSRAR